MKKRNISEEDRQKDRQNALRGTEKTKGKKRSKSKYGVYSWGFESSGKGTKPRKHKGRVLSKIFRFGKQRYTLLLQKEERGKGKKGFGATFLPEGKPQSSLDGRLRVEAGTYGEAEKKAIRAFKSKK